MTRTLDLGDGVTLELVRVPGGTIRHGFHRRTDADEAPRAVVEVKPFWMATLRNVEPPVPQVPAAATTAAPKTATAISSARLGYDQDQPDQPAVRVSWDEADGLLPLAVATDRPARRAAHRSPVGMGLPRRQPPPRSGSAIWTRTIHPSRISATRCWRSSPPTPRSTITPPPARW